MRQHTSALRKARYSGINQCYLITTCTKNRFAFFNDYAIGRCCIDAIKEMEMAGNTETLAFVVMPDHLHWLMRLLAADLTSVVAKMKSHSASRLNQRLGRHGAVWQRGFHDHAIRKEEDLIAAARYVVANPLRKGLVRDLGAYPLWDSVWLAGEYVPRKRIPPE